MRKNFLFFTFLCILFSGLSVFLLLKELTPFIAGDVLAERQNSSFDHNRDLSYGYSGKSKSLVLTDCLNGMQLMQVEQARLRYVRSFSEKCLTLADDIISKMPTNSQAWLVRAWAGGELFIAEVLNQGIQKSQSTAPNELWLAKIRLELAQRKSSLITENTQKLVDKDIGLMASNYQGSQDLASRYTKDEAFRERVVAIIQMLPQDAQKRFIYYVRSAKERG